MVIEELKIKIDLLRSSLAQMSKILEVHGYDYIRFQQECTQLSSQLDLNGFHAFQLKDHVLAPFFDEIITEVDCSLLAAFTKIEPLVSLLEKHCLVFQCTLSNPNEIIKFTNELALSKCDFDKVLDHYKLRSSKAIYTS